MPWVLEGGWIFYRQVRGRCKERAFQAESIGGINACGWCGGTVSVLVWLESGMGCTGKGDRTWSINLKPVTPTA